MRQTTLRPSNPRSRAILASLCLNACILAALSLHPHPLQAQEPPPDQPTRTASAPATGPYRITGRVVSATDARGLEGATISITSVNSRRPVASTIAGERGIFAFEHLPPGKYSLLGESRGFLSANYNQHDQFSTAIVTGTGFDTEALILRLQPAAHIGGRVIDESGEPVQNAQLSLYREEYTTGIREVHQVSALVTDDRGEYTIGPLPPGKYFLSVHATPWYAIHPQTPSTQPRPPQAKGALNAAALPLDQQPASPILTGVDPALDVAYPITFYGDVTDSAAATPIPLKAGEQTRADVRLKPVKAVRVTVPPQPGNTQRSIPMLRVPVFDALEYVNGETQQDPSGAMEIVGLAPGHYQVEQRDPRTGQPGSLSTIDTTSGPAELEPTAAETPAALTLTLEEKSGQKLPPELQVVLRGKIRLDTPVQNIDAKGEVHFNSVSPGLYTPMVFGENRLWQPVRIEEAATATPEPTSSPTPSPTGSPARSPAPRNLLQNGRLSIAAGETLTARLIVTSQSARVEGVALRNGKPAAGAMIVLVPVDALDRPETYRRDQSDLDGTFLLPEAAPGRYIVIAIEDGWNLEWRKPEVLTPFLLKGTPLEIAATNPRPIHLPTPIPVQSLSARSSTPTP